MRLYEELVRPWLFRADPEDAHEAMLHRLAGWRFGAELVERRLAIDDPRLAMEAFGVRFHRPLGLAAGLDKNGVALPAWRHLGFGFCEVGTVTPRPQAGNPRPRLFRLPADEALVNRLGFNGAGAQAVRANLRAAPADGLPVGVNVGKNRDTPDDQAAEDYASAISAFTDLAGWFVINVSSPNTPGLRRLQQPAWIRSLVETSRAAAVHPDGRALPVLVKVAPDFEGDALEATVEAALEGGAAGFVATNTTIRRDGLRDPTRAAEAGGLSGRPVRPLATETIRRIHRRTGGAAPIVGVGGVDSAEAAYEKILAGATLLECYTGLVFRGPTLARDVHRGLIDLLERDGCRSLAEAVGAGHQG